MGTSDMKLNLHVYSVLLVLFVLGSLLAPPAQAVINIMPLGDSITSGSNSGEINQDLWISYRMDLWDTLNAAGYVVNFVGTKTSGSLVPDFDPNHEGHGGWRAFEIVDGKAGSDEGKLADWLDNTQPDIVLLHIGTNDISWGSEDWNDVEDIENVCDGDAIVDVPPNGSVQWNGCVNASGQNFDLSVNIKNNFRFDESPFSGMGNWDLGIDYPPPR